MGVITRWVPANGFGTQDIRQQYHLNLVYPSVINLGGINSPDFGRQGCRLDSFGGVWRDSCRLKAHFFSFRTHFVSSRTVRYIVLYANLLVRSQKSGELIPPSKCLYLVMHRTNLFVGCTLFHAHGFHLFTIQNHKSCRSL